MFDSPLTPPKQVTLLASLILAIFRAWFNGFISRSRHYTTAL